MINRETKKQGLTLIKTDKKDKKAAYTKPALMRYGAVEQRTHGTGGTTGDAGLAFS